MVGDLADHRDDVVHRLDGQRCLLLDRGDALTDRLGRRRRRRCELLHLVGDDAEALARFAGTGRLDRRVEREQVGLHRDVVDHPDDVADLGRTLAQLEDALVAGPRGVLGPARDVRGLARAGRDTLDRLRDLIGACRHRGDVLVHRTRRATHHRDLAGRRVRVGVHRGRHHLQLLGRRGERVRAVGDAPDAQPQIVEQRGERMAELAHGVVAVDLDGHGEITVRGGRQRSQDHVDLALQLGGLGALALLQRLGGLVGEPQRLALLALSFALRGGLLLQPELLVERRVEFGRQTSQLVVRAHVHAFGQVAARSGAQHRTHPADARPRRCEQGGEQPDRQYHGDAAEPQRGLPLVHEPVDARDEQLVERIGRGAPEVGADGEHLGVVATVRCGCHGRAGTGLQRSHVGGDVWRCGRPDGLREPGVDGRRGVRHAHPLDRGLGGQLGRVGQGRERLDRTSGVDQGRGLRRRDVHQVERVEVGVEGQVRGVGSGRDRAGDLVDHAHPHLVRRGRIGPRSRPSGIEPVGQLGPRIGDAELIGDPGIDHRLHGRRRGVQRGGVDLATARHRGASIDGGELEIEQGTDHLHAHALQRAEVLVGLLHLDVPLHDEAERRAQHEGDEGELPHQAQSAEHRRRRRHQHRRADAPG
ncbi:MAG: hypothetical protein U0Q03_03290 [Acidimicrobiales bacterium]